MMRLNRARWLRTWAEVGTYGYCRGIQELRAWMFERGYILYPEAYTLRVTDEGRAALEQAIADHARHGRPNLGEATSEQRARRESAEARGREQAHEEIRQLARDFAAMDEWARANAKPPEARVKTIAETMQKVKTYAVLEGDVVALLEALKPLRADPHVIFVEPWLEEALDGVPERTAEELHQVLNASSVPGDLVVTHGVVAMVVAARCKAMGRRVVLVVTTDEAPAVKAELAQKWPQLPQLSEWVDATEHVPPEMRKTEGR